LEWVNAIPLSAQDLKREVSLHWAGTDFPEDEFRIPVNIAPGDQRRLDIAFSRSGRPGRWLATHRALTGRFLDDAALGQGEYKLEICVTFEDGDEAKSILHLFSSQTWNDLNASGWSE
jgi:hypothetical protein